MEKTIVLSVGKTSTPQQEAFVRRIEAHLQAHGLVPRTVGRSAFSSGQPLKLVSELMTQCYGTVIVAFERTFIENGVERRGSGDENPVTGRTLPTVWNQIEAAMAYVHGHPLLVIVEHGLKSEGLPETNYDWYVQWCRLEEGFWRLRSLRAYSPIGNGASIRVLLLAAPDQGNWRSRSSVSAKSSSR